MSWREVPSYGTAAVDAVAPGEAAAAVAGALGQRGCHVLGVRGVQLDRLQRLPLGHVEQLQLGGHVHHRIGLLQVVDACVRSRRAHSAARLP